MIYKEISYEEYCDLQDTTGAYLVLYPNGDKSWYIHEERHRKDGPAVEEANGTKYWYLHGKLHREDGPAVEWDDGTKEWWVHGLRHREDGPAIERADGTKAWWIRGIRYQTKKEWEIALDELRAKEIKEMIV